MTELWFITQHFIMLCLVTVGCGVKCIHITACDELTYLLFLSGSCSVNQRTNVISCVTVHDSQDSDSSTSTPLSSRHLPNLKENNARSSRSLAVVMPSVKAQLWDEPSKGRCAELYLCILCSVHLVSVPFIRLLGDVRSPGFPIIITAIF